MTSTLDEQKRTYAELLITVGVNLQHGQSLRISAEIAHRAFVRQVVAAAYDVGAKYVQVDWIDSPTSKQRFIHSEADFLDYFPGYEKEKHQYWLDKHWARLALVGPEYPNIFDDVDPTTMRRVSVARSNMLMFYMNRMMANDIQWCVAAVPTRAWAMQIYPDLSGAEALTQLWQTVLATCRVDADDPELAWQEHCTKLDNVIDVLATKQVRSVHFVDSATDEAGRPLTDLTVGLTGKPIWMGASSETPDGTIFIANMPTEEVFSAPDNRRTEGYVRITKPAFPFEREVRDAYFRFKEGEVVEYYAAKGEGTLTELFAIDGAKRLGEVALVDISSPIYQAGLTFYETLFDENATCHIAFGSAYPEGYEGGTEMSEEELSKVGVNRSQIHVDVMIGSATMNVYGICADGTTVTIMESGQFVTQH